jgi:hypothetical protein
MRSLKTMHAHERDYTATIPHDNADILVHLLNEYANKAATQHAHPAGRFAREIATISPFLCRAPRRQLKRSTLDRTISHLSVTFRLFVIE